MTNKYFDLEEAPEIRQPVAILSGALIEKFFDIHCEKIESIKALTGRLPNEGEIYFLWTINSFNAFTFIPFLIRESGIITELIISTYSINKRIIDALVKLVDQEKILQVHILISDSVKTLLSGVNDHLVAIVENKKQITVRYAWNHSKIALIRTGDNHFIVEGSGNWGENARHEHYEFLNTKTVYEFRKNEILTAGLDS